MTITVVDLPDLHKYDHKVATKFLEKLSETENIELYSSDTTRAIVELKWPLARRAMIKYLLYPYLVLLAVFLYYACIIFEDFQEEKVATLKAEVIERRDGTSGLRANATRDGFVDPNASYHDLLDSYTTRIQQEEAEATLAEI